MLVTILPTFRPSAVSMLLSMCLVEGLLLNKGRSSGLCQAHYLTLPSLDFSFLHIIKLMVYELSTYRLLPTSSLISLIVWRYVDTLKGRWVPIYTAWEFYKCLVSFAFCITCLNLFSLFWIYWKTNNDVGKNKLGLRFFPLFRLKTIIFIIY